MKTFFSSRVQAFLFCCNGKIVTTCAQIVYIKTENTFTIQPLR